MPLTNRLGYVGRILLHSNPFQSTGFNIQISLLIIAPVRYVPSLLPFSSELINSTRLSYQQAYT